MDVTVKRASAIDASTIAPLFNQYRIFYQQEDNLDLALNFIHKRLLNDESVIFFALDNHDNCIGFTQLYPSFSSVSAKRTWVLNDLYVAENARKSGVAKILMAAAKDYALSTHAKGIALETAENNVNAQKLYDSLGYKKEQGFIHYFLTL